MADRPAPVIRACYRIDRVAIGRVLAMDRTATTPVSLRWRSRTPRAYVWELAGAPQRLMIALDATLITAHKDPPAEQGGYGFAPMNRPCG